MCKKCKQGGRENCTKTRKDEAKRSLNKTRSDGDGKKRWTGQVRKQVERI
jgi:hypothetical protein